MKLDLGSNKLYCQKLASFLLLLTLQHVPHCRNHSFSSLTLDCGKDPSTHCLQALFACLTSAAQEASAHSAVCLFNSPFLNVNIIL